MINGKHYFREFLQSEEKIASNILSSRLKSLEKEGLIHKSNDPEHKQKIRYLLTQKGIDLFPILMEMARWSLKYKEVDPSDAKRAQAILNGGSNEIQSLMQEMQKDHVHNVL